MGDIRNRFRFWLHNQYRRIAGFPPYTRGQWDFMERLMQRSVTARRLFLLISTGTTYGRSTAGLTEALGQFTKAVGGVASTEEQVAVALNELVLYGLLDQQHRPMLLVDIVE